MKHERLEVKESLKNITRLARTKKLDKDVITYIRERFDAHINNYTTTSFVKTLEESVSELLEKTPERIKGYLEHLEVILSLSDTVEIKDPENEHHISRMFNPEYIKEINDPKNQQTPSSPMIKTEYIKASKELFIKMPSLAKIIHDSINDPPLKHMDYEDDRHEINHIREKRDTIYQTLKDIKLEKTKLQMLERGAIRLAKENAVVAEEFWITAGNIINNRPELFQEYTELGAQIEAQNISDGFQAHTTATYLKFAPKLLFEAPERFPSFKRWSEYIIPFVRDKSTFFRYAPELMIKDPKLFKEYVKHGLKASNISGPRYTPQLEQNMFWHPYNNTEIDYFEIGAKFMHIGPEAFRLYIGQLARLTNNFTDNTKARGYLKELVSPTRTEGNSFVTCGQSFIRILENNFQSNKYRNISLHSENLSGQRKFWNSSDIAEAKIRTLAQYIRADLKGQQYDISDTSTFSDEFVDEISKIKDYTDLVRTGRLGKITESAHPEQVVNFLTNYFSQRNVSSEFIRELKDIKKISESVNIMVDKIGVCTNKTPLEDFVNESKHPYYYFDPKSSFDCLAFDGKYADQSANLLINTKSVFINVDAYLGDKKVDTITRAIATAAICDNKKVLYIAGVSSREISAYFPQWRRLLYTSIIELARRNQDDVDGVVFDLNPRNRSRFSHEWAEYVAAQSGLQEGKDYVYEKRSLATEKFPTHRKEIVFELINPKWEEIKILRDEGLEGKFFLEGVMQEPKNKEIGPGIEPDLVYDKGYVIGKYVSIK